MAGTLRFMLPKNTEIVRVPCAGRIETIYLLKALKQGADGFWWFAVTRKTASSFGETSVPKAASPMLTG
jgi:coenzyme F420-reducing hydrogenase delta subunit